MAFVWMEFDANYFPDAFVATGAWQSFNDQQRLVHKFFVGPNLMLCLQ
jgi:hypothetical protein